MSTSEILFQIALFLLGAIISIVILFVVKETQKKIVLVLGVLLIVVLIALAGSVKKSFSKEEVNSVLGAGNWRCFPNRLDGVAFIDVPQNFIVEYPISNVDKEGRKYMLGEVVPAGGSATAWLQGALSSSNECP